MCDGRDDLSGSGCCIKNTVTIVTHRHRSSCVHDFYGKKVLTMDRLVRFNRTKECLRRALRLVESLQESEIGFPVEENDAQWQNRCGLALREAAIQLYKTSTELLTEGLTESCMTQLYQEKLCPSDQVMANLEPDAIHIRLPMLSNRQSRSQSYTKDVMFADSVRYAIRSAPHYDEYDFARYRKKNVSFLYVYEAAAAHRGWIADNDNHEVKFVLDAIVCHLPEGDTPLSTSIHMSTVVSDDLAEGTYICVSPSDSGIPAVTDILEFWAGTES